MALADRPWLRRGISVCLMWHIVAVAVAPFALMVGPREEPPGGGPPRPGSPAAVSTSPTATSPTATPATSPVAVPPELHQPAIVRLEKNLFRWYLNALYLNHGYSFFAPDPGPSLVMTYEVHRADGTTVEGRLPDVERHWPRLLYHRYFMLTSQNLDLMIQAEARGKVPTGSTRTLGHAIARHLTKKYQGERTVLRLFLHRLLWPEEVLAGKSPNAPDTFLPSGELTDSPSPAARSKPVPSGDLIPAEEVQP